MQRHYGNLHNFRTFSNTHQRYNQHVQWSQHFQQRRPYVQPNYQNLNFHYWCETCDKGFLSLNLLEGHKRRHERCHIDGCQFVAHPKIITRHIQMQHSTGLFKKISKLNNPEEIKKWREERKSKYPTLANIKKKEAIIKEKINRGEKMGIKNKRNWRENREFHNRNNQKTLKRGEKPIRGSYHRSRVLNSRKMLSAHLPNKTQIPRKINKNFPIMEDSRKLKPFAGIQDLLIDNDDDGDEEELKTQNFIEDDDYAHNNETVKQENSDSGQIVCSALTSLIGFYGSSDEDDDTNEETKKTLENADKSHVNIDKKDNIKANLTDVMSKPTVHNEVMCQDLKTTSLNSTTHHSDDDSGPEEVKIKKEDSSVVAGSSKTPINTTQQLKNGLCNNRTKEVSTKTYEINKRKKLPSTLLEKLLHKEITHERNVILQCIRYVVENKFFDKH